MLELLTTRQMGRADRLTIEGGTPGLVLMEAAGEGVARAVLRLAPEAERALVLCGPGNNGGDGFVAARILKQHGLSVTLALLGPLARLTGDAAAMAARWDGEVLELGPALFDAVPLGDGDVIVDAMFGAGLVRELSGAAAEVVRAANASPAAIVAVDVPSGVDGTTGEIRGAAIDATLTVTFFRRKPGHLLLPGRIACGAVQVVDIGIGADVLPEVGANTFANAPGLWRAHVPVPRIGGHKYDRGHAVVVSGPRHATGAARMAARGALRVGAGLVTVASPTEAADINAAQLTAVMVHAFDGAGGLADILADSRKNAVAAGPGMGVGAATRDLVATILKAGPACVLDADALTSHHDHPDTLFAEIAAGGGRPVVLTPHDGEFARLFDEAHLYPELREAGVELPEGATSKLERARRAAKASSAVVILKGADTVIAAPDGRAAINENAPPWLSTAGSGDVLTGLVAGLLAQGIPAFEAASAAVWLHGAAGTEAGLGLIAEDLPEALPAVLRRLLSADAVEA